jgi:hypothetical protein
MDQNSLVVSFAINDDGNFGLTSALSLPQSAHSAIEYP